MDIVFTILGLIILLLAGDLLVRGAVNFGLRLGIPTLIVSLTIVAFGTSAPELLIAIRAALAGSPGIVLGNVVGSNTANILLVLGLPALVAGIYCADCDSRKTYGFMMGATIIFIALSFLSPFGFWHGLILLSLLSAMLIEAFVSARRHRTCETGGCDDDEISEADPNLAAWKIGLYLLLGIVGLPYGAALLVDGALGIARELGISESVIGLTLIAVGTSLPELATTVMATLRRHGDVVIGNVIGSNMFNILAIMGVASMFGPLEVPHNILAFDLWVMLGSSLLLAPIVFFRLKITRVWGAAMLILYGTYLFVLLG